MLWSSKKNINNEKAHTPIIHSYNNFKNIEKEEKDKEDTGITFVKKLFGESYRYKLFDGKWKYRTIVGSQFIYRKRF